MKSFGSSGVLTKLNEEKLLELIKTKSFASAAELAQLDSFLASKSQLLCFSVVLLFMSCFSPLPSFS